MNLPTVISFDPKSLVLTNVKKNRYTGRQQAYLNDKAGSRGRIAFKAPKMRTPFDTKCQTFDDGKPKCQVALSFDDIDPSSDNYNADLAQFHANIRAVEEMMIQRAANDPQNWLGQALVDKTPERRLEIARRQFTPIIRKGAMNTRTGKPYADTIRVKLYLNDSGEPEIPVKMKKGNQARTNVEAHEVIDLLTPNTRVKIAFSFSPVWFKRSGRLNTFGMPMVAQSLEIFPYERRVARVISTEEFNTNEIVFGPDQKNAYGSPTCHIGYGDLKTRLTLASPWGSVMGSKDGTFDEFFPDTPRKRYFRLRYVDTESTETTQFIELMMNVQNMLLKAAQSRSKAWFNEELSEEDIRDYFSPILRQIGDTKGEVIDAQEPYYIKFKLPLPRDTEVSADGPPPTNWRTRFIDRNGESIDGETIQELLQRGSRARVTFQACPVWVMSSSTFGLPFEAVSIQVDVDIHDVNNVDNHNMTSRTGASLFDDDPDDIIAEVAAQLSEATKEDDDNELHLAQS